MPRLSARGEHGAQAAMRRAARAAFRGPRAKLAGGRTQGCTFRGLRAELAGVQGGPWGRAGRAADDVASAAWF